MKLTIRRLAALACCAGALTAAGCNTVEGVGKDIQKGGEKLENAAK